jgi:hypothetical protein
VRKGRRRVRRNAERRKRNVGKKEGKVGSSREEKVHFGWVNTERGERINLWPIGIQRCCGFVR